LLLSNDLAPPSIRRLRASQTARPAANACRWVSSRAIAPDEACYRLSPLTRLPHLKTPTLIFHAEHDRRCPLHQGQAWYQGLKAQGVAADLIANPGEGHAPTDRPDASRAAVLRRASQVILRFLRRII
jgi:dipeptidyl aminopeptidase/acylaminoacyl peptidase